MAHDSCGQSFSMLSHTVLGQMTDSEDMSVDMFDLPDFSRCSVIKKRTPNARLAIKDTPETHASR